MNSPNRSLEEIYEDYNLYDKKLERDRKKYREEFICKLRKQNRDLDFIPELEWSRDCNLEHLDFNRWSEWWQGLSERGRKYLENEFTEYRAWIEQADRVYDQRKIDEMRWKGENMESLASVRNLLM